MIKTLSPILGQILFCFTITCYSQATLTVEKFKNTDNFIIHVSNPLASKIVLVIKDKEGKSLLQESYMFVEKLRKVLFLGSLEPGDYVIEVFNGEETKLSHIKVEGLDKTVHPENGKMLVVGFSKLKTDNSVDIIVQNKLDKNVSLKIFKNKALLNDEDLGSKEEIIKKVFKMSATEKGDYIIKVGTKDNLYHYRISQL
jgi:hypothetical protein